MSKSLVIILHYNTTKYTDNLYEILKPHEKQDYDLVVVDNGSEKHKISKYTSLRLEENVYYGGGLDVCMNFFLENTQYDSLMVMNSDLIVHGHNFVASLREALFSNDKLMLVSGCVLQPEGTQCYWKMVHNWGYNKIRYVPWIDYQSPLMKRQFVEEVKGFGSKFGWVQDIMTGIICQEKDWKIGVCDWVSMIHFGNGTVKDNLDKPVISQYNVLAEQELLQYFREKGLWEKFIEQRQLGESYHPKKYE